MRILLVTRHKPLTEQVSRVLEGKGHQLYLAEHAQALFVMRHQSAMGSPIQAVLICEYSEIEKMKFNFPGEQTATKLAEEYGTAETRYPLIIRFGPDQRVANPVNYFPLQGNGIGEISISSLLAGMPAAA